MSKYQVFEISKDGKRIIESGLSLEKAESVSQEVAKSNLENVYGYEPVYAKEIVKMDNLNQVKDDFKERNSFAELVSNGDCKISLQSYDWLIAQAEKVEELQRRIDKVTAECGVTWINEVLQGKEPKRTELIRQLGEKACDRNDKALKKMEEWKMSEIKIGYRAVFYKGEEQVNIFSVKETYDEAVKDIESYNEELEGEGFLYTKWTHAQVEKVYYRH